MAEYRRFVAYVYEYQKGRKGSGCGFIRVEAWEKRCRMEAHIKCPGLISGALCSVYGFTRSRGWMEGWILGTCRTAEGRADCVVETERSRLGGRAVMLEQLGGMVMTMDNGGFFGTEWDDQPIRPETFRMIQANEIPEKEDDQAETTDTEPAPEGEGDQAETTDTKPVAKEEDSQDGDSDRKQELIPEPEAELKAQSVEEIQETETLEGAEETGETEAPWEPFSDGELTACQKISLQDIGRLGRQSCGLRNNRFLQHGFYQFGHLLLCRNCQGQWVLGVPGGYDRQEQYMANMFGFPYFKASGEIQISGGKGGYWYRFIGVNERGR